jgi:hypothetical protein
MIDPSSPLYPGSPLEGTVGGDSSSMVLRTQVSGSDDCLLAVPRARMTRP